MPRPLKRGILSASKIILSKDIDKYAYMCGLNFHKSDFNLKKLLKVDCSYHMVDIHALSIVVIVVWLNATFLEARYSEEALVQRGFYSLCFFCSLLLFCSASQMSISSLDFSIFSETFHLSLWYIYGFFS